MFTKRLIENASTMFTETPPEVMYAYSEYQQMFGDMKHIPNVTFHEGLPDKQTIEEFSKNKTHTLLILDDLISKIVQSEELLHLFTVTSHHANISCVLHSQSLYPVGKYSKSISLNIANFVLFRNPRDSRQIVTFASQIFLDKRTFLQIAVLKLRVLDTDTY